MSHADGQSHTDAEWNHKGQRADIQCHLMACYHARAKARQQQSNNGKQCHFKENCNANRNADFQNLAYLRVQRLSNVLPQRIVGG